MTDGPLNGPSDPHREEWSPDSDLGDERPTDGTAARDETAETDQTDDQPSEPVAKRDLSRGDYVRAGVRGLGQTLVTLGVVVLLFVVYEVWVTNIFADAKQHDVKQSYAKAVQAGKDPLKGADKLNLPAGTQVILPNGVGIANLYIPALGKDYAYTIVEGTDEADLEKGPGHYTNPYSAIPGQIGNFAVAGHRVGKGEPFLNLDKLKPGNSVVVETATNWFVYTVLGDVKTGNLDTPDSQGVVGREIVPPSDVQVVAPVPNKPGTTPTRALMTMTTCTPKYSATDRMIVHAVLARSVPVKAKQTPRELGGTL